MSIDSSIPTRVISLKGSERRALIEPQLAQLGIAFQWFDAINGDYLTPSQLQMYDDKRCVDNLGRSLSHREIACALSHRALYQEMVDQNMPCMLIFEDDAVLSKQLACSVSEAVNNLDRFDLLSFFSSSGHLERSNKWLVGRHLFYKSSTYVSGAVAYLITLNGAKTILNDARVTHVSDWPRCITRMQLYVAYPNLVEHNYQIASSLEPGRLGAQSTNTLLDYVPRGNARRLLSCIARVSHIKWLVLGRRYPSYRLYYEKDFKPIIKSLLPFLYIRRAPLIRKVKS